MRLVAVLMVLAVAPGFGANGTILQTFEFSAGDFVFDRANGYDVAALPGQYFTSGPGLPLLPLATYNVLIPPDAEVAGVKVVARSTTVLPGEFNIHPCQRPQVLSLAEPAFVGPDPVTYESPEAYPEQLVSFTRSGCLGGFRLAGIQVVPLQYVPARRELQLVTRLTVEVSYERNRHEVEYLDGSQIELMAEQAQRLVVNPERIGEWRPVRRAADGAVCDMMVVTTSALASSFTGFADWKTARGIMTVVVRTESIYATYPGRDNQEKIRNCIIDYWRNRGVKYVLIGGDAEVVPVRLARITCEGNTENIATDMYYADLQYSWDSNRNNYFGEMGDSVDLFYDLFIGRTPADNSADVALFFAKCTTYEKHPDTGYIRKQLLGSTMLFTPFHGRVINRMIADEFPAGWTFAHLEDPPSGQYASRMSQGFGLSHVAAHGNQTSFSVMDASEAPGLTNGLTRLCFVNSIACQSGWFDGYECLAEALVKAQNGGCIATMLNSRYGFGYPPGFGPSEMLDLQFYRQLLREDATQFGALCASSKDYFQSMTMGQEVWRWCVYELNLFGDPSLQVWSERPETLHVVAPDSAAVGPQVLRVAVARHKTPIAGALVCLSKGNETYARGRTNSQGWVDLWVNPTAAGSLSLSVSAHNCYPHESAVPVRGSVNRPALVLAGVRVDDGFGNGRLDPGETADLYVKLANAGSQSATGVSARLRSWCPWLTLPDSTADYGTIAPGDTVEGEPFTVTAAAATPEGTTAEMVAACFSGQGGWEPFLTLPVGRTPQPRRLWADHDTGNMILSVTSVGSIGTLGPYGEGSGLKYPRDAGYGSLYFTSLALGNSPSYVVDRWYGQPSTTYDRDWRTVETLQAVIPPVGMDEEYQAVISDSGHAAAKGLVVTQWSGAKAAAGYRDFVIVSYSIENRGAAAVNGLYAGIFSDFDVNNTTSNRVFSDAGRRLTYMAQASSFANSAGIKLLSPRNAANLSAIDHTVYVTPAGMMTEAVKDSFLRGTISQPNSNRSANWSCVVSAGPFDLEPGQRTRVAFAIVGGSTQAAMLANADSAQSFWDNRMPLGLAWLRGVVDDAPPGGNGDGLINPGEAVNLPTWVANRADRSASGVWGVLRRTAADTLVTVTDSLRYFGRVGAGDSAFTGPDGFKFRVAASCTNRFRLPLELVCRDTLDSMFVSNPVLEVAAPQLVCAGLQCWDPRPGGNNNGRLDPGESAEVAFGLLNAGPVGCANVTALLKSTDARLVVLDSVGSWGAVAPESTVYNSSDRFRVAAAAGIPPETQIACTLFVTGTGYQVTRVVAIGVGLLTAGDPIPDGPRTPARYWAYDDVDTFYVAHPEFDWVEITGVGTRLTLLDDETRVVDLPAGFGPWRYYGQSYTQVSICSNGWLAPGPTASSSYLNSELPNSSAPMLVAANWDDLYPPSGNGIWFWHDTLGRRFVVQWDSIPYYNPRNVYEWFQVIVFDTTQAGPTGDNDILVQYRTASGFSSSTVGLQDETKTIGIQCLFDGARHRAAAGLGPGRAILYTTDSVVTGLTDAAGGGLPKRLELAAAPNPARSRVALRLALPQDGLVRLTVHDVTGRVVRTLADSRLKAGVHVLSWDRRDDEGRSVASGIYVYRLETGSGRLSRKAVVLQ